MSKEHQNIFIDYGIDLTEKQMDQFEKYYDLLIEWNEKINLTAITDKTLVFQKHFLDSLSIGNVIDDKNVTLLDVGSGAGFPSIPLKIMYPQIQVTIIDALQKRISFLGILCKALDIEVELIHGRAEEYNHKNNFDFVTARAVANLQLLSELCIPFVKTGGFFIAMKGPKFKEEIELCSNAFEVLGASMEKTYSYDILEEQRTLLLIKKNRDTDKMYPRRFKLIKNRPL